MPEPQEKWSADLCGGRLQTFLWEHHDASGERLVRVWTPPGWEPGRTVKALWLNDGQNLFRDEDAFGGACWGVAGTVAHLIAAKSIPPIVVIGIDHTGRMRTWDYLSAPPTGWDAPWGQGMRGDMWDAPGGGVDDYLARIMTELLPWAQQRFGLSPEPAERYFGGSSFGGICALYMAMKYPGEWAGALVESPSFWAGNGRYMADVAQHDRWPKRMYLAMGELEYTGFRGTERPGSLQCDAFLRDACGECAGHLSRGNTELLWLVEPGGKHNERDWGRRLPCALRWLFGYPEAPMSEVFWTRPSPVPSGGAFEVLVKKEKLSLPPRESYQVHLGFDQWSKGVQRCDLLPSGLAAEGGEAILACLAYAPPGSSSMHLAVTNGVEWDNNQEKNYELPVG